MIERHYLLVLCVLLLGSSFAVQNDNSARQGGERNWKSSNTMSLDEHRNQDGAIYIDEHPTETVSSGDGSNDDEYSGKGMDDDEDSDEGSANPEPVKSACERLKEEINTKGLVGAYVPSCTVYGDFERKQCHGSTGYCWCVDSQGREIDGTKQQSHKVDCFMYNGNGKLRNKDDSSVETPDFEIGEPYVPHPVDNNNIDENPPAKPGDNKNKIHNMADTTTQMFSILTNDPETAGSGSHSGTGDGVSHTSIMGSPGILAGIIGGAVVGLLCAVLLVMFIVYRMRKKDEGSYALEDHKPAPGYRYHQANTKEFYA